MVIAVDKCFRFTGPVLRMPHPVSASITSMDPSLFAMNITGDENEGET